MVYFAATPTYSVVAIISYSLGIIGLLSGAFGFLRYSSYKTTVGLQNDNIKALQDQAAIHASSIETLNSKLIDAEKEISRLQGRNEVVESLPLKEIFNELKLLHKTTNAIIRSNSLAMTTQSKTIDRMQGEKGEI